MCLLVFAWRVRRAYPLVFAGNRDELHARPAAAAGFWNDNPQVLGGRDLLGGGTWLGVTARGRFAAVTNYRAGPAPETASRSRGALAADFLRSNVSPASFMRGIVTRAPKYGAFSLLVGNHKSLWYYSNRGAKTPEPVPPGFHGLSNHLLDTPWPKVRHSVARLKLLLAHDTPSCHALFRLLSDRSLASEMELPDTGIGIQRERLLSSPFIVGPVYGSRCSSQIFFHSDGDIRFAERRFSLNGYATETCCFHMSTGTS